MSTWRTLQEIPVNWSNSAEVGARQEILIVLQKILAELRELNRMVRKVGK